MKEFIKFGLLAVAVFITGCVLTHTLTGMPYVRVWYVPKGMSREAVAQVHYQHRFDAILPIIRER